MCKRERERETVRVNDDNIYKRMERQMSIASFGRTVPWRTVIPASFFAASAVCYLDPTKAPAIAFLMIGFGMTFFDPVADYFTKPAAEGLSKAMTDAMLTFNDKSKKEQTDKLLDALANSVARAVQNSTLTSTVKRSIIEALSDDELQSAAIQTLQIAMKKAADNEDFKGTLFNIIKGAFVGALNDEAFVQESMHSAVASMVAASRDEELRNSMLSIITEAVTAALHDEEFIGEFQKVVKGCLSDGSFYRSGAKGVFNAAFGGLRKTDDTGTSETRPTEKSESFSVRINNSDDT